MAINTFSGGNFINSLEAAGKNKIINGDFEIWQRGSSLTPTTGQVYTADRFLSLRDGSGATVTVSRQTFTTGAAGNPTNAINGTNYFYRQAQSVAGTSGTYNLMEQRIEGAILAGQTVTFSFWAKAASSLTLPQIDYEFTVGGTNTSANVTSNIAITTSWTRYSYTFTMPTYSGYTPNNTSDFFGIRIWFPSNATFTFDTWGWQLELGTTATTFSTATGTIQGELAACQRYYYRQTAAGITEPYAFGSSYNSTGGYVFTATPVTMRVKPTSIEFSNVQISDWINNFASTPTIGFCVNNQVWLNFGGTGMTGNRPYVLNASNATSFLAFNAEL